LRFRAREKAGIGESSYVNHGGAEAFDGWIYRRDGTEFVVFESGCKELAGVC